MSDLRERVAAEHYYHPGVPRGQDCACGEPLPGDIVEHIAKVTEAAVEERYRYPLIEARHAIQEAENLRKERDDLLASVKPSRDDLLDIVCDTVGYLPDSDKERLADAILALPPGRSEDEVREEVAAEAIKIAREGARRS